MKILETYSEGKLTEKDCEDAYVLTEDFVAVIDGVTSKSDFRYQGKATGKLAAELVKGTIERMPRESSLEQILSAINSNMQQMYEEITFPYDRRETGMQATCVIYSDFHQEIWLIGDCQAVVDGVLYENPKLSDQLLSDMRALIIESLNRTNPQSTLDENARVGRDVILPWIKKATIFMNDASTKYGYSIINGDAIPESLMRKIKLEEGPHEIILTSDGYPVVDKTLQLSEQKLQEILQSDPQCYQIYPSTKGKAEGYNSFDDRTYIRFEI